MYRIVAASVVAAFAFAGTSFADELRFPDDAKYTPAYVHDWTGFYAGISGGAVEHHTLSYMDAGGGFFAMENLFGASSPFGSTNLGYNVQYGFAVLGIEADYGFADAASGTTWVSDGSSYKATERLTSLGTARARLGYAFGNSLFYATGGFAYGRVKHDYDNLIGEGGAKSGLQTGWAVGAGFEQALGGNFILTGQVLYADLGCAGFTSEGGAISYQFSTEAIAATIGLKYKFGGSSIGLLN